MLCMTRWRSLDGGLSECSTPTFRGSASSDVAKEEYSASVARCAPTLHRSMKIAISSPNNTRPHDQGDFGDLEITELDCGSTVFILHACACACHCLSKTSRGSDFGMHVSHVHRQAVYRIARQECSLCRHGSASAPRASQDRKRPSLKKSSKAKAGGGGLVPHEGQGAPAAAPSRAPCKHSRGRRGW